MIYLLTAIALTAGGSSTVHIYTETMNKATKLTQTIRRTTQLTNWEVCAPCLVFASYTLAFILQLRKRDEKKKTQSGHLMFMGPCIIFIVV